MNAPKKAQKAQKVIRERNMTELRVKVESKVKLFQKSQGKDLKKKHSVHNREGGGGGRQQG